MKLTNYIRDAFIKSVMNDVPTIDYSSQAHALVNNIVDGMFKTAGVDRSKLPQGWLGKNWYYFDDIDSMCVYGPEKKECQIASPATWKKIEAISAKAKEQKQQRDGLESRLRGVAYGVTTRKALAEALPEFEKYLPVDEPAAMRGLPVVANVVTDFVKAGWPKGKKP